jgi:hypothetical protein
MKTICLSGLMLMLFVASAGAQEKVLTTDPLTGLPLISATDPGFQLGNAPTRLPDAMLCKSKMQADFYSLYHTKVDAALAWYGAHLPAFKKMHGYANHRSQDYFYNADHTLVVSITGDPAEDGQNTEGYSVSYLRFQPPLSERAIVSMGTGKVVCQ